MVPKRGSGARIGLFIGLALFFVALAGAGLALIWRSMPAGPAANAPDPAQTANPTGPPLLDAKDGGASPKPADAADSGAGSTTSGDDSAKPTPGSVVVGTTAKVPAPMLPGTPKKSADPFKGSRTGK
jgi:hypothetical protein